MIGFVRCSGHGALVSCLLLILALPAGAATRQSPDAAEGAAIAADLAAFQRASRTVISSNQGRINDPALADKGLTGDVVLDETIRIFAERHGWSPRDLDPDAPKGILFNDLMDAIVHVVDEHQQTINQQGVGFKGFIPAVFGRLVNERFNALAAGQATLKATAPRDLVRNRKALPDAWENRIITERPTSADWSEGEPYSATVEVDGRQALRVLVPEYYDKSCLACHGEPKGELDVTGYPKEGGHDGDLGGLMSVTLYR